MKRISTDAEYLDSGRVVIDADGIPVELGYRGVGFPEGKVSAPVGSVYTDTAATAGAIRWIKTSGTGNTGWRVEYGDTGWRNIHSLIVPEPPSGTVDIRRHGSDVCVALDVLEISGDGNFVKFDYLLPAGFRPDRTVYLPISQVGSNDVAAAVRVQANGTVTIYGTNRKSRAIGDIRLLSSEPWPTILPGTPS